MPRPGINDVMGPNESYKETVVRVPLVKIVLPNPSGTSIDKYEPEYVVPLLVELWRAKFAQNPALKPKVGKVPPHLPQYRDITSVEDERGRLQQVYGMMRGTETAKVDHFLGADKLWSEIKRCGGELIEREVTTHHSFHHEDTARAIPATAQPFDVLDELPFDLEMEGDEDERDIETPESLEKTERQRRAADERLRRMAEREAVMAKRAQKERKAQEAKARADEVLGSEPRNPTALPKASGDSLAALAAGAAEDGVVAEVIGASDDDAGDDELADDKA
jgi:hypothetical protein